MVPAGSRVIAFTKVALPFGWLGNMSPHPVRYMDKTWRTTEALFQALRFNDVEAQEAIRGEASPMTAKFAAKARKALMVIEPGSPADLDNMRLVLRLKVEQHPAVKRDLLATGDAVIIEDCTRRRPSIWGAQQDKDGNWIGENWLGVLWMELREELKT